MPPQDPIPPYSEWLKTRKPPTSDIPTFDQFKASRSTRPRNQAQAESDVANIGSELDKARNAYMSASGQKLNPPVDTSTAGGYRPLTSTEQAAQKRGEPVIISEAGSVTPELPSRPRTVTPAPVSLDPVIQGRLEQIEREKRQRETQAKVEQARAVMQRRQGLVLPAGQRNQGTAYQPTFGKGQTYREWNPRAAEAHEKPGGMVMGEFRHREERDARVAREIRPQVVKDYFAMGAGVRQDIPTEIAEQQIAADPKLRQYIESETERRAKLLEERENKVSRVERNIEPELGIVDKLKDLKDRPEQLVPFINSVPEISDVLKVGESADKLERGEDLTTEEMARLREFLAAGKQGKSIPYQIAEVISGLPAFVGEFALTGGAYSLGKEAALKGLQRVLTKEGMAVVEKKLAGRIATKVATGLVGAAAQTLPSGATRIPAGVLYREQSGQEFGEALRDTLTDQFIEIASERAGGLLSEIPLPKKLAAIRDAVTSRWINKVPGRKAEMLQRLVEKSGWHGPLGEIFEERVGDVAKYATGLQASPIPSLEQLAVEGLAFSLPGVVEAGANKVLQSKAPAPQTLIDYAINSPLTTAEDKAKIEKLVASGVTSTEDVQAILSGEPSTTPVVESKEVKSESLPKEAISSSPQVEQPVALPEKPQESQESQQTITEIITKSAPLSEAANKISAISTTPQSQGQPTVEPPTEVNTQPSATESQLAPTEKGASGQGEAEAPLNTSATGAALRGAVAAAPQIAVADKSQKSEIISETIATPVKAPVSPKETVKESLRLNKEVADISPRNEEPKSGNKPASAKVDKDSIIEPSAHLRPQAPVTERLTDWGTRLKTIAQSKNLDDLQALSDEMAAHTDDPRVVRLRGSIQEQLAKARQPEIPEREPERPAVEQKQNLSKAAQKTLNQAETAEGKTVRPAPTHRIGAPKADASRNSLEQQVRAHGGIKDASDQAYKGELKWLSESAKRGSVNQTGGISVEQMATKLAQDGYGKDVWWEGSANNVDPQAFLQAAMDDARGSTKHYSTERDAIEDDPDVKAWDTLAEDDTGKELIERVQSGHARASDIVQFVREASAHGLSDNAIDAFVSSLQRTVQEELSGGTEEGEGYTLNEDGTLLDPDGSPLFAREFQLGLPAEGLTQQAEQPKTDDQRERLRREQQERDEAADPERAAALRKLAEIRRRGMTVEEYSRQGSMFEAAPSQEEIKLLRELERKQPPPESGQSSMFARGESGSESPFAVEGNRVSLNQQGAEILTAMYRELGLISKGEKGIRGTYERKGEAMVRNLAKLADRGVAGAKELGQAVEQAVKAGKGKVGKGKVVLFYGESARKHELFHEASDKANRILSDRHGDLESLTSAPQWERIQKWLIEQGYPNQTPVLAEEAAAHIAEGRYEQMGLTREEAIDWMELWFKSFEKKNPHVTPRQFQEMSDEATAARDKVYATESQVSQPQSDQTLPSVQAGRAQGAGASLARTSDVTQTEAFKRWFGESKVVDEEGKPLVVYHGTAEEFNAFDSGRTGSTFEIDNTGFYFTNDADLADRYADAARVIAKRRGKSNDARTVPVYLSLQNPWVINVDTDIKSAIAHFESGDGQFNRGQQNTVQYGVDSGYDGIIIRDKRGLKNHDALIIAFRPEQIKSAIGNRGSFDPNDPNILMARSDDPWADLMVLSDEFGRLANQPELAEGEEPRSLPKTLEAAGLEAGPTRGYLPESIVDDGVERAKQVITDKGIDGAMEFVRTGDGIEWASTGYEVSGRLRAEEASLRAAGKTAEADEVQTRRLKFLDDFAMGAVERGRSIVGIKAIAEYAPDRMAYMLNKASLKKRKRGISPEEEARITKLGEELGALADRNKALEKALDAAKAQAKRRAPTKGKAKQSEYQTRLDEQAQTVLQTLKPKVGHFDLAGLERPSEKGALTIGIPPLPGDAELIAQYAAAKLSTLNTVADLNAHLLSEFGQELDPYLSKIRQRAYAIRQEARLAEIESEETEPKRRKTILSEIQKEIGDSLRTIREAQKAQDLAQKAERAAERKSERTAARSEAKEAREQEHEARKQEIKDARVELKRLRQEMKEASKAETKGYRETIKAQKDAARKAELWDTPIRNEAYAARERLKDATDVNDPSVMEDLVSVAAAKFLPEKEGGTPRAGAVEPARLYRDLKDEFPELVSKKNQAEIYKRGYQRIQDATAAAREAARMRSASAEAKRLWDELGVDVDAQAVLIQQAEVRRQTDELRRKAVAEFNRVNKTMLERVWMEAQSIPRALQSSIDAPLGRQGAYFLLTHPLLTLKSAVPATLQGYGSIHVVDYARHETDLKKHPDYDLATKSGLDLSVTSGTGDPALVAEEQFQSPLASKLFPHVRLSEQGYVLGMNAQRLAMFSRLADTGRADGYTPETHPEFFEAVAGFVNDGTGRGNLPDAIKRASALTNFFFFSTRLNISRIQLLNDLFNPVKYVPEQYNAMRAIPGFGSYDPAMRKIMAKELIRLGISLGTVYLIASAMGIKIDLDPDDPDALLLRVRNTRYDITGGEVGTIRFLYRMMRSIYRTANGEELSPFEQPLAIAAKFTRYKLAPLPGGVIDVLTGKDAVGQPANLRKFDSPKQVIQQNIIVKRLLPMMTGNLIDAVSEEGWIGLPMTLPALAGFGMSSYPDRGIRAIKNQAVVDTLEDLKITSQSLLGQKTKDDELDKAIESRIMAKVETLDIPTGATDIGKEKLIRERLAQIRLLAKAETALADPERYKHYLSEREAGESLSFLSDDEKKTLTDADLKAYRQSYAENYLKTLQRVAQTDNYQKADDDRKEKILARVGQAAHTLAKVGMVKMKRKGTKP